MSKQISADQYHLTVLQAQVSTHRGQVFFEVIRWQVTSFQMIAGSSLFFFKFIWSLLCFSLRSRRFRLVSEQKKTVEEDFRFWPLEKWNENQKITEGEGEEKEGNACRQTSRFWKPAFASERSARLARLVEQYWHVSIRGLFHTERSWMVRHTHLNFLRLLLILVGKIYPPSKEHFL